MTITTRAPDREKVQRYIDDIVARQSRLSFRRLPDEILGDPIWLRRRNTTPLTTVAALESQIPARYLLAIYGFRLSQYLRLGWACADTVYTRSLFAEPRHRPSPEDLHVVTFHQDSGRILGYVSLAHGGAVSGQTLGDRTRAKFPFEVAHRLWVQDEMPDLAGVACESVREVKRFVRDVGLHDEELRARVPWEVLTGAGGALQVISPRIGLLVGDLEECGALQHLLKAGLRTRLIENTSPSLPIGEVMRPVYIKRKGVKPFVAEVPPLERIELMTAAVDASLASATPFRMSAEVAT
jgi:hypothetical protein